MNYPPELSPIVTDGAVPQRPALTPTQAPVAEPEPGSSAPTARPDSSRVAKVAIAAGVVLLVGTVGFVYWRVILPRPEQAGLPVANARVISSDALAVSRPADTSMHEALRASEEFLGQVQQRADDRHSNRALAAEFAAIRATAEQLQQQNSELARQVRELAQAVRRLSDSRVRPPRPSHKTEPANPLVERSVAIRAEPPPVIEASKPPPVETEPAPTPVAPLPVEPSPPPFRLHDFSSDEAVDEQPRRITSDTRAGSDVVPALYVPADIEPWGSREVWASDAGSYELAQYRPGGTEEGQRLLIEPPAREAPLQPHGQANSQSMERPTPSQPTAAASLTERPVVPRLSFAEARLLVGAIAPAASIAQEPLPVTGVVTGPWVTPNNLRIHMDGTCHFAGLAQGNVPTSRIFVRVASISCLTPDGRAWEFPQPSEPGATPSYLGHLTGATTLGGDPDNYYGIDAKKVSDEGPLLLMRFTLSVMGDYASAVAQAQLRETSTTPALGGSTTTTEITGNADKYVLGRAFGERAVPDLNEFINRLLQEALPYFYVPADTTVNIVLEQPIDLGAVLDAFLPPELAGVAER